jgi:hypothetical protein
VYDASTGAHLYSVPVPGITTQSQSTLVFDDATNSLTAYISSSSGIRQVHLGADSGSVGWAAEAACGGGFPALVGNSLVCASPGRYYAIDQTSGAVNQFQAGGLSGGGNATPAYDPVRDQFYILEMFNSPTPVLSAYHYSGNGSISLLWQRSGPGFNAGSGLALDADGNIYTAASTTLQKLDPSDGATIDSATPPSAFIAGMAPILNAGYIWADTGSQSLAFDLETLSLAGTFPGMRGSSNTPFKARGVLGDSAYVMDLTGISPQQGFKVYMVPEPVTACLLLLGFWMARPSRTRRRRLQGT